MLVGLPLENGISQRIIIFVLFHDDPPHQVPRLLTVQWRAFLELHHLIGFSVCMHQEKHKKNGDVRASAGIGSVVPLRQSDGLIDE